MPDRSWSCCMDMNLEFTLYTCAVFFLNFFHVIISRHCISGLHTSSRKSDIGRRLTTWTSGPTVNSPRKPIHLSNESPNISPSHGKVVQLWVLALIRDSLDHICVHGEPCVSTLHFFRLWDSLAWPFSQMVATSSSSVTWFMYIVCTKLGW